MPMRWKIRSPSSSASAPLAQFVEGLAQQLAVVAERHPAVIVHRVGRVLHADPQHIDLAVRLRGIGGQPAHRAERGAGARADVERPEVLRGMLRHHRRADRDADLALAHAGFADVVLQALGALDHRAELLVGLRERQAWREAEQQDHVQLAGTAQAQARVLHGKTGHGVAAHMLHPLHLVEQAELLARLDGVAVDLNWVIGEVTP